jgi:hypothetical protein
VDLVGDGVDDDVIVVKEEGAAADFEDSAAATTLGVTPSLVADAAAAAASTAAHALRRALWFVRYSQALAPSRVCLVSGSGSQLLSNGRLPWCATRVQPGYSFSYGTGLFQIDPAQVNYAQIFAPAPIAKAEGGGIASAIPPPRPIGVAVAATTTSSGTPMSATSNGVGCLPTDPAGATPPLPTGPVAAAIAAALQVHQQQAARIASAGPTVHVVGSRRLYSGLPKRLESEGAQFAAFARRGPVNPDSTELLRAAAALRTLPTSLVLNSNKSFAATVAAGGGVSGAGAGGPVTVGDADDPTGILARSSSIINPQVALGLLRRAEGETASTRAACAATAARQLVLMPPPAGLVCDAFSAGAGLLGGGATALDGSGRASASANFFGGDAAAGFPVAGSGGDRGQAMMANVQQHPMSMRPTTAVALGEDTTRRLYAALRGMSAAVAGDSPR